MSSVAILVGLKFLIAIFLFAILPGFILIKALLHRISCVMILPISFLFSITYTEIINRILLPQRVTYYHYYMVFFGILVIIILITRNRRISIIDINRYEGIVLGVSLFLITIVYFIVGPADDHSLGSDLWRHLSTIRGISDASLVEYVEPYFGTANIIPHYKYSTAHFLYAFIVRFASFPVERFHLYFSWYLVVLSTLLVYGLAIEIFGNKYISSCVIGVYAIACSSFFPTNAYGILSMKHIIYPNTTSATLIVPALFYIFILCIREREYRFALLLLLGLFAAFQFHPDSASVFVLLNIVGLISVFLLVKSEEKKLYRKYIFFLMVVILGLYSIMVFMYYPVVPSTVKEIGRQVGKGHGELVFVGKSLYIINPKLFLTKMVIVSFLVSLIILIRKRENGALVFMAGCTIVFVSILLNPFVITLAGHFMNPPHVNRIMMYLPYWYLIGYSFCWVVFGDIDESSELFSAVGALRYRRIFVILIFLVAFGWVFKGNSARIVELGRKKNGDILFNKGVKGIVRSLEPGTGVLSDLRTSYVLPVINDVRIVTCVERTIRGFLDKEELYRRDNDYQVMSDFKSDLFVRLGLFKKYNVGMILLNFKHRWYREINVEENRRNMAVYDSYPAHFKKVFSNEDYVLYKVLT